MTKIHATTSICLENSYSLDTQSAVRWLLRVTGIVQGIGFRPFVYNLAQKYGLAGWVGNDNHGVFIEIEGVTYRLDQFLHDLKSNPPPLAHIETITQKNIPCQNSQAFIIKPSEYKQHAHTLVSPDLCICENCLVELNESANRRYHYPFINCTNCGPRLTIIQDLPYDRPLTTMADFPMCPECEAEYHDPTNRRFHAQPNACPACGPQVWYQTHTGKMDGDGISLAQQALHQGKIVAIKGLGGFHLACDATNATSVELLRTRKGRLAKPFALMMSDMTMVRRHAEVNREEESLLLSRERPIVLLQRKAGSNLADSIAPGNQAIGVMLPYTPLHYLLLADTPLVMTSANVSGEPLVKDNTEVLAKLSALADGFLLHNRDIEIRCDDSVVRVIKGEVLPIRRARGYAPFPVTLPFATKAVLAVGGELKATFCLTQDKHALLSQHIGDMENLETLHAFEQTVHHYEKLFHCKPEIMVCDQHPRYLSSRWAEQYASGHSIPLIKVQHHHAHIAAVMAENGLGGGETVLGFCFDGTGYGTDGTIWGGEVLTATYQDFTRSAYLKPMPLIGGDAAIKHPYRLALAQLWSAGLDWDEELACVAVASAQEKRIIRQQLERNINIIPTSSMGRLFDGISSLLGICHHAHYEAQAAIELEAHAQDDIAITPNTPYVFAYQASATGLIIDPRPVLTAIVADIVAQKPPTLMATYFHYAVADMILHVAQYFRTKHGEQRIALSGGVFQNAYLLKRVRQLLQENQFDVIVHRQVPPNDGGLALGQAVIAASNS